jgi:hypothetical protein
MNPISITIESKPTTINFDGRELQVQKLSIPLPFGRKPTDISDIAACGVEAVYVTEIREMDPETGSKARGAITGMVGCA